MSSKKQWLNAAGGGLVVGILIGLAIASSGETDRRILQKLDGIQSRLAMLEEDQAGISAALNGMQENAQTIRNETDGIMGSIASVSTEIEGRIGKLQAEIEASRERDAIIGDAQAALGAQLDEVSEAVSAEALRRAFRTLREGSSENNDQSANEVPQSDGTEAAASSASDFSLTSGSTIVVGGARLFAYRIGPEKVIGLIDGTEGVSLELGDDPAEIGGCAVSVSQIKEGVASLDVTC
ncbi:MAG: hypothetical protein AAGE80_17165 [Pseudomonadota bacterium]